MKAQTLSICLPGTACDKKCPYCVSKMTWAPPVDDQTWNWNLPKVVHFAKMAQVTDVIITGKGEPSLNEELAHAANEFRDWPVVVQTNGKTWARNPDALDGFMVDGKPLFNIISVSIDDPKQVGECDGLWKKINSCPVLTSRITVMLTSEVCKIPFKHWVQQCVLYGIRGLSFREITVPSNWLDNPASIEVHKWIQGLKDNKTISNWLEDFEAESKNQGRPFSRRLPYGAIITDFDGISVTKFDFCIQDESGDDDIRSLVYNQDGHLYTSWGSPASIIF